jgi:hypothetical protein
MWPSQREAVATRQDVVGSREAGEVCEQQGGGGANLFNPFSFPFSLRACALTGATSLRSSACRPLLFACA